MKADKLIYAFSSSSKNWSRVPTGFEKTRAGSGFKKVLSGRVKFVGSGRVPGFSKTRASPNVKLESQIRGQDLILSFFFHFHLAFENIKQELYEPFRTLTNF